MIQVTQILISAMISLVSTLLSGKTVKAFFFRLFRFTVKETEGVSDTPVLENIKTDWQLSDKDIDPPTSPSPPKKEGEPHG